MKRISAIATLLSLSLALSISLSIVFTPLSADAQELGARAYGMGGAYAAHADDIAALVYNPAGLPGTAFELSLGLGSNDLLAIAKFQTLLNEPSSFSGDAAIDVATLSGVSIGGFGIGLGAAGELTVSETCGGPDLCGRGEYMTQLLFGYGRRIAGLPFGLAGLQAGVSVKRLDGRRIEFQKAPPAGGTYAVTVDDWRGQGYSATLGVQFEASDVLSVGIAAHDVVSSLTWTGARTIATFDEDDDKEIASVSSELGQSTERLDPVYRVGLAVRPPLLGLTLAADAGSDGSIRYGAEKELLLGAVDVRLGGSRSGEESAVSGGIGLNFGPFRLDLAAGSADGFQSITTMVEGSVRF